MRLIDADKLRFRHTVKCNSDTTRPYTLNCISFDEVQSAPTIKAIPIDVLDKIREEIRDIRYSGGLPTAEICGYIKCLEIIDKHMERE